MRSSRRDQGPLKPLAEDLASGAVLLALVDADIRRHEEGLVSPYARCLDLPLAQVAR
jgi:hypothetical protein